MISTAEASAKILGAVQAFGSESVATNEACGRVLQQVVTAERDQPPFDRVMMDGIAISFAEFAEGKRSFTVQSRQHAGDAVHSLEAGSAIEIMTGATLPEGADCIVPVERITVNDLGAHIEANYEAKDRQFIHPQGSDYKEGDALLQPGVRISPMEVAVIASCGLAEVKVTKKPRITVISTGNELVDPGKPIEPHQIRTSNGPAVVAMLKENELADAAHDHLVDEPDLLHKRIEQHLNNSDALILSGGVSMGKADFIPDVLKALGVEVLFHKITQKPGKPMWFGMGKEGQAVFALPGNPVSTLTCCRQYVVPALRQMSGMNPANPEFASLAQPIKFAPKLTNFLPVRLISNAAGQSLAMPQFTNTSGDFHSLSGTDGYVELAADETEFNQGQAVLVHRWRV